MNKKDILKKIFGYLFILFFVLNTVFFIPFNVNFAFAQQVNPDDFPNTAEGYEQYMRTLLNNPDYQFGDQLDRVDMLHINQQFIAEQNQGDQESVQTNVQNMPGAASMNLLYPIGPRNTVDNGFRDIAGDIVSCTVAMMAVNLAQVPMKLITRVGTSIDYIFKGVPEAGGFWTLGLGVIPAAWRATARTQDEYEAINYRGAEIFDVPIFLSGEDIAFCIRNVLYSYLTGTVIRWVNEGFNDAALWVEDLASTLNNVYAISYREAIGEVNLCVDIEAAVHVAVDLDFLKTQQVPPRTGCTISIQDRVEANAILDGTGFSINTFEKLYTNPSNNAMGGYLVTTSLANSKSARNESLLTQELSWGDGWWPIRDQHGRVVTPGQALQNKVADLLSIETENAKLTDKWNQVIFLISNQLIKKEFGTARSPFSM